MIIISCIAAVLVAAIGISFFLLIRRNHSLTEANEGYVELVNSLQQTIDNYGTTTDVYVLNQRVVAGQEVSVEHLTKISQPQNMITEAYVQSEADLKSSYYRCSLEPGTPLTYSLLNTDTITHQDRLFDVVTHIMPVGLKKGDFVDIRLVNDYGQDYIVLAKKRVSSYGENSLKLILNEEEIHRLQSATVDTYLHDGTILYCTTYIEPAFQRDATPFYPVSQDVLNTMLIDPNIFQVAELEIIQSRRERFETDLERHTDADQNNAAATGRASTLDRLMEDIEAYREKVEEGIIDPETGERVISEEEEAALEEGETPAEGAEVPAEGEVQGTPIEEGAEE